MIAYSISPSEPLHAGLHSFSEVYDVSVLISENMVSYPGDMPYERKMISRLSDGQPYNLSALILGAHAGTHLDSPAHFLKDGKTLDQYPTKRFIMPAHVVSIKDESSIGPWCLKDIKIEKGDALLFKTQNSRIGLMRRNSFSKKYVYMSKAAAELCVEMGVNLVGIDYLSIDRYGEESVPAHKSLLGKDVLILEGIDLAEVPEGSYTLFCLPLRIKDSEGAPARAVLMK
ncbi:MAG: cyclase family protein [Methanotrichaceae archaeon]|nr:cyclase family protein [Methanotrichaceae archaeon]MDD1757207.1 cyclase family protein [Methanotrichaceae archaeon]